MEEIPISKLTIQAIEMAWNPESLCLNAVLAL